MMFVLTLSFSLQAENLSFKNFGKEIVFEKNENGFVNKASQQQITISNRLIIKTANTYSKKDLTETDSSITDVKELYQGNDFTYFVAEINKESDLQEVMKTLDSKKDILLVQADILQQTEKSHEGNDHKENLLKKPARKKRTKQQMAIIKQKQLEASLPRYLKFVGVDKLWEKSKGKGVKIAVIDDGFDLKHKEFKKLKVAFSYDASEKKLSTDPKHPLDTHGTKVAGVLFAQHDKTGVEGIAPEAEFIAIRQPDTWTSNTLLSFQIAKLNNADIVNCSWNSPQLMQPVADAINDLTEFGRNGKGTAVVIASGNKGIKIKPNSTEASIKSAIVVGASNLLALRPLKFSNTGESIDLLSFGRPVQSTLPMDKYGNFAKTSLSATIVSGISALVLSQNPDYTLKQLQTELMKITSDKKRTKKFNLKKNTSTK